MCLVWSGLGPVGEEFLAAREAATALQDGPLRRRSLDAMPGPRMKDHKRLEVFIFLSVLSAWPACLRTFLFFRAHK